MPTERQIAANRQNSQKSTGPRSQAGKAVSCMNALKTGVHAESHIIRGEDAAALAQLAAEYNDEFRPTTPRQRDLVDAMVRNEWKVRRLERIETDAWDDQFESHDRIFGERRHPVARAFDTLEDRLERLQRRLHAYERSTARAMRQLRDLQALESTDPSDPIGFVPSNPVEQASRPAMPASEPACAPPTASSEDPAPATSAPPSTPPQTPDPRPQPPAGPESPNQTPLPCRL